ncbi:hypothetical protein LINPERHAP1_LOCUS15947, partial [Linum perenne]
AKLPSHSDCFFLPSGFAETVAWFRRNSFVFARLLRLIELLVSPSMGSLVSPKLNVRLAGFRLELG